MTAPDDMSEDEHRYWEGLVFSMELLTVLMRYCPARPGVWSEYDEG